MDPQKVDTSGAPIFYKNILKFGTYMVLLSDKTQGHFFGCFKEPLIHGTRFDGVGNTGRLIKAGCTTLEHLVNTAGPDFENIEETAAMLGFKSIRLGSSNVMSGGQLRRRRDKNPFRILSRFY